MPSFKWGVPNCLWLQNIGTCMGCQTQVHWVFLYRPLWADSPESAQMPGEKLSSVVGAIHPTNRQACRMIGCLVPTAYNKDQWSELSIYLYYFINSTYSSALRKDQGWGLSQLPLGIKAQCVKKPWNIQ